MTIEADRRAVLAGGLALGAMAMTRTAAPIGELIYIGTQTGGIYSARFDPAAGKLSMIGRAAELGRANWAVNHPRLPIIYFAQGSRDSTLGPGAVIGFRIDLGGGALNKWCEMSAGGTGTTYLAFDHLSNTILGANFGGAQIFAAPVKSDGTLGEVISQVAVSGSGPTRRQASAHPHSVALDPSGRWLVAADLGADRLWVFPFDRRTRQIGADDAAASRHFALPPGAGPRHISFHPNGRSLYLVEELSADIVAFAWDAKAGRLAQVQRLSTDDPAFTGTRSAAEVTVSRDGRFVYVSNRSDHMMVVYSVDSRSGRLKQLQRIAAGGTMPWHFAIHASNRWLIAANRDADTLAVFRINPRTGLLSDSNQRLAVPKPVFIDLVSRAR